jgi:hypothetical protein
LERTFGCLRTVADQNATVTEKEKRQKRKERVDGRRRKEKDG